jgi:hypothetical protein
MLTFFHFVLSSILLIISCVIYGFLALFLTFPTKSLYQYMEIIFFYVMLIKLGYQLESVAYFTMSGKAIPLQALTVPEGSRRLRLTVGT